MLYFNSNISMCLRIIPRHNSNPIFFCWEWKYITPVWMFWLYLYKRSWNAICDKNSNEVIITSFICYIHLLGCAFFAKLYHMEIYVKYILFEAIIMLYSWKTCFWFMINVAIWHLFSRYNQDLILHIFNDQRKLLLSRNGPYLKFAILEVFIFANVISSSAFFLQQIVPEYSSHYNPPNTGFWHLL